MAESSTGAATQHPAHSTLVYRRRLTPYCSATDTSSCSTSSPPRRVRMRSISAISGSSRAKPWALSASRGLSIRRRRNSGCSMARRTTAPIISFRMRLLHHGQTAYDGPGNLYPPARVSRGINPRTRPVATRSNMSDFSPRRALFLSLATLLLASAALATTPTARYDARIVYVPVTTHSILFGGSTGVDNGGTKLSYELNDTWDWNGTIWTQLFPRHVPTARYGHVMVWDSARKRIVMFGGRTGNSKTDLNDTWIYKDGDWTQ